MYAEQFEIQAILNNLKNFFSFFGKKYCEEFEEFFKTFE